MDKPRSKVPVMIAIGEDPDYGGGERFAAGLADKLSDGLDYSPILLTLRSAGKRYNPAKGVKFIHLDSKRTLSAVNLAKILSVLLRYRVKIVHANSYLTAFYLFFASLLTGAKKKIWFFHSVPDKYFLVPHRLILMRIMFYLSTDIIVCSKAVGRVLVDEFKAPPSKVRVVYHGMQEMTRTGESTRRSFNFYPCIGLVARMDGLKGHDDLLSALKLVKNKYKSAGVVFCGDGDHRKKLEKKVKEEGLSDSVVFAAQVEHKDISSFYRSFDIFALPTLTEAFGMSIVEAMYFGVPVVATNVGGIPEIIDDGINGLLVRPGDPQMLSDAIIKLWEDKGLYNSIRSKGIEKASRFTFENTAREIVSIYSGPEK